MALREAAPSAWFVTPDLMLLWSQDNAEKQKLGGKGPMNRGKYRINGPKPRPSLATGGGVVLQKYLYALNPMNLNNSQ